MKEVELSDGRKVVVKKLKFGEMNEVFRQSTKIKTIGKDLIPEVDWIAYKEILISKATGMSLEEVRNLEVEDGEKLYEVAVELNPLSQQKTEEGKSLEGNNQ